MHPIIDKSTMLANGPTSEKYRSVLLNHHNSYLPVTMYSVHSAVSARAFKLCIYHCSIFHLKDFLELL